MNKNNLYTLIESGALVLTPNRRLARTLLEGYSESQQQQGRAVWSRGLVLSMNSWLQECWQVCEDQSEILPQLLSEQQELLIWENIIRESSQGKALLKLQASAKAVRDAWHMLQQWQVKPSKAEFADAEDSLAFYYWADKFQQYCKKNNMLSDVEIINVLAEKFNTHRLKLPKEIILACFDDLPPQTQSLLTTLEQHQVQITQFNFSVTPESIHKIAIHDAELEIQQMALWAQSQLDAGNTSIGCVIPDLNQRRAQVLRIFREANQNFTISSGLALNAFPIIHAALLALQYSNKSMPLFETSCLLRSPYIGYATELQQRHNIDVEIRALGEFEISHRSLLYLLQQEASACPLFAEQVTKVNEIDTKRFAAPSEWAELFSKQLKLFGWPGERSLNSEEYQLVKRWQSLLAEFATLDSIVEKLSRQQALNYLNSLARSTLFQAESDDTVPIKVLGLLEAAGMEFDSLWVMGLDDETWPAAAKPNPFIPLQLQRQHEMPHASAERELYFSRQLTQRFCQSARQVIFSYAQHEQDRELQCSPLIREFPDLDITFGEINNIANLIYQTSDLERLIDDTAPAVSDNEIISGGTFIFKQQAACPFKAFAEFRLGAAGLDSPDSGLNALERGICLHQALDYCWQELGDQQTLCSTSDDELNQIIQQSITNTLTPISKRRGFSLSPRFFKIEQQRLHKLISNWLSLEKSRSPFKVVSREEWQQTTLGGIVINMRADRIDELEDGTQVIIDYKTGKPNVKDWFDERLDEPQLPIYCVSNQNIKAILYGQVRIEDSRFKGIAAEAIQIPGVKTLDKLPDLAQVNWAEQVAQWAYDLEDLADEFRSGHASVDPKNPNKTCEYCELHSLCRIN